MDRRNFLKNLAIVGTAFTLKMKGGMDVFAQTIENLAEKPVDLVAVLGGEPDVMFQKAIAEMGGIGRFVKKGYKVVVKPNIGWDKTPELAANTNPILIKEIVRQCIAAGAKEVAVFDNSCDNWKKCYESSGIEAAAKFFNQIREMPLSDVQYLSHGQALKIGTMDIDKLNIKRINTRE